MKAAVFLDRDGVLCEDRADYVRSWADWRWVPGALEGAAAIARAGRPLVVITNQACIGKGLVPRAVVDGIHRRMGDDLAAAGAPLAGVYVCPHAPDDGCDCRKPRPGMLLAAARDLDIDLAASTFVGDNLRDGEAAAAAGARFVLILTGQGPRWLEEARRRGAPPRTAPDLRAAADLILRG